MEKKIKSFFDETQRPRRKPKQKRSIEKLNRILDAATMLMANQKHEKLTTSMIAKSAGVAVGSVYQFYSNVEEIKEALLSRVLSQIPLVYQKTIQQIPADASVGDFCDALIDTTVEFYFNYPVIVKIILASTHNKEFLTVKAQFDKIQLKLLITEIMNRSSSTDVNEARRWVTTLILLGDIMAHQIWTAKNEKDRDRFVVEWKALARHYADLQLNN